MVRRLSSYISRNWRMFLIPNFATDFWYDDLFLVFNFQNKTIRWLMAYSVIGDNTLEVIIYSWIFKTTLRCVAKNEYKNRYTYVRCSSCHLSQLSTSVSMLSDHSFKTSSRNLTWLSWKTLNLILNLNLIYQCHWLVEF